MPLNDDILEKIMAKMQLKRRIALEVVNSHLATIGVIKQKPTLQFDSYGGQVAVHMRTKREVLIDQLVPVDKLRGFLESIVLRFRKLQSVSIRHWYDRDLQILIKTILDSLVCISANYANMKISRFSADMCEGDDFIPSIVQWIGQFAGGLKRLELSPMHQLRFPLLNATIQAVGRCQNLRHLDLIFRTIHDVPNYLNMLTLLQCPARYTTADPSQPLATVFTNNLATLPHLHTLRLLNASIDFIYDFLLPVTRHTLTFTDAWLSLVAQPTFKPILDKIQNLEVNLRGLPLNDENRDLLSQVLESKPPSASIDFHAHKIESWQETPMDMALANWLLLAKQTQKHIQLSTFVPLPTEEQLTEALVALPIAGIIESKVVAEERHFYYQFGNGSRLTVTCRELLYQ